MAFFSRRLHFAPTHVHHADLDHPVDPGSLWKLHPCGCGVGNQYHRFGSNCADVGTSSRPLRTAQSYGAGFYGVGSRDHCVVCGDSSDGLALDLVRFGRNCWSPGALVRARWIRTTDTVSQLNSAFALEAAVDEFVYIVGPVVATVLGTVLHPTTGVAVSIIFLSVGAVLFLSQRSSEPLPLGKAGRAAQVASDGTEGSKDAASDAKGATASAPARERSLLLLPAMIVLMLTYTGMGAQFGANDIAVVAFTKELGVPALSGVLLAMFSLGSFISALIYGARSWRRPLWQLFAIGVVALAIGMTAYLLAHTIIALAVIMLISGIACAPTMTNVNMMVAKSVPRHRQTEGLAWLSTAINLGVSLGSSASGPAVDRYGSGGAYVMIAIFAWVMVLIMLVGLPPLRRSMEKSAVEEAQHQRDLLNED